MPKLKIDWRSVPDYAFLAETNCQLAARLHCSPQNVARERRARALAPHPRGGDRPGPVPEKPAMRLSRSAAARLRALARTAGLSPSAYLLALPPPPP